LQQEKMETCCCCNEHWFQMDLRDGVCAACNKDKQNPPLFSDANCMDPGPIPTHLALLR
jgi:hypothetical protein